ncbi:MAG: hypothetical protein C0448_05220 [Sphingobacteriaceae bacterium]|nr:hypothetical protein [Sphingobacteriaceae bacterium]
MTNERKYTLTSLVTIVLSIVLMLYGIVALGLFSSDKIIVSTLQTTGPDYNVSFGQFKLARLMPDSIQSSDVSGIMVTEQSAPNIDRYLIDTDDFDNYYLLTFKMVGVQKSDSYSYHPLLEISSCRQIDFILFWSLIIIEFGLVMLSILYYRKYKRQLSSS